MNGKEVFKRFWLSLPLVDHLAHCTRKNHAETIKEISITLLFSTATFWVSALFLEAFMVNKDAAYHDLIYKTISAGQLFIFAVTFLGPVFLIAGDDPENAKVFPNRSLHFIALFILAIISSGFYAIQLSARELSGSVILNSNFLLRASVVIAILSIVLRYLTIVYRKSTFDPNRELIGPVNDFAAKFAARDHE